MEDIVKNSSDIKIDIEGHVFFLDGTIWLDGSPLEYAKTCKIDIGIVEGKKIPVIQMTKADFWELAKQGKF